MLRTRHGAEARAMLMDVGIHLLLQHDPLP